MTAEELEARLQQWKHKYFEAIAREELQQHYLNTLERALGRLALLAEGLDPVLDQQLKNLRHELRGNRDSDRISVILEKIQTLIQQDTSEQSSIKTSSALMLELLDAVNFPPHLSKEAARLAKAIKVTSDKHQLAGYQSQWLELINSAVGSAASGNTDAKRFWQRLLSFQPRKDHLQMCQGVLFGLLEKLHLPEQFSEDLLEIRVAVERHMTSENLPFIVDTLASLVNSLGREAELQKLEYRAFLTSLTDKINQLDMILLENANEEAEAYQHQSTLGEQLNASLDEMRRDIINDSRDAYQLKSMINLKLTSLCELFDDYRHADESRHTKSLHQISKLKAEMALLEDEAQRLRDGIRKAQESMRKDALTGIWNRQAMMEMLEQEYVRWKRYQNPLTLVIWDIDNFKQINDEYGHMAGDKILKEFANILTESTRSADFVARYGGEEFVGIFPETDLTMGTQLANKIREKIKEARFVYEGNPVPVTVSAGVASFVENDSADDVFKRADQGLYQAKKLGRDNCVSIE